MNDRSNVCETGRIKLPQYCSFSTHLNVLVTACAVRVITLFPSPSTHNCFQRCFRVHPRTTAFKDHWRAGARQRSSSVRNGVLGTLKVEIRKSIMKKASLRKCVRQSRTYSKTLAKRSRRRPIRRLEIERTTRVSQDDPQLC